MQKKKTTIRDIAKATGLSVSTVCYALTGKNLNHISKANQDLVHKVASRLNYTPNLIARGLSCGRSNFIGLLLDAHEDSFQMEMVECAEQVMSNEKINVILCSVNSEAEAREKVQHLLALPVEGFIAKSFLFENAEKKRRILPKNMPCVLMGGRPNKFYPSAMVSMDKMVKMICDYLLSMGHHCFAMDYSVQDIRREAILNYMTEHGEPEPAVIPTKNPEKIMDWMMAHPERTALISDDREAAEIILLARSRNIPIPKRFSILGNDGLDCGRLVTPALTTIAQPRGEQGVAAAQLLLKWIKDGVKPPAAVLMPFLIERDSVANICNHSAPWKKR